MLQKMLRDPLVLSAGLMTAFGLGAGCIVSLEDEEFVEQDGEQDTEQDIEQLRQSLSNGAACTSDNECASDNCHEEGSIDRCRPSTCTNSDSPNDGEFCDTGKCGPCLITEGDCDSDSECAGSLVCHEEGQVDKCRTSTCTNGDSVNDGEFCDTGVCGPCGEDEGDCDSNTECDESHDLVCNEEGQVDKCRAGSPGSPGSGVSHVDTTEDYDCDGENMTISRPSGTQSGDLLVLFVHRTDDEIPIVDALSGWTYVGMCATHNGSYCREEDDCTQWQSGHTDEFCKYFGGTYNGRDLAQAVYYKVAGPSEPSSYSFDLNRNGSGGAPGWLVLTALRGADTSDPIVDFDNSGMQDGDRDSIFPSVYGESGGMVLLSMSNDDGPKTGVSCSDFEAPSGTSRYSCNLANSNSCDKDEAGFLYGKVLTSTGQTGTFETIGDGDDKDKDLKISLTIRPAN